MIVAGIDIGSRASKAVLLKDGEIVSTAIIDTGPESIKTSNLALDTLLSNTGIGRGDIDYTVATGYGRILVPFAGENVSEISCHAKGINRFFPTVRTILDMGGQDCKAIRVDGQGDVTNFVMNDKCAGGTGRFLEIIADVLGMELGQIGEAAMTSQNAISFNTICAVFAKSEAMAHRRKGVPSRDILAGLNDAISTRCLNLLKKVSIESDFSITGGIAKNKGMVAKITEKVGIEPLLAPDPQLIGALGAALFAGQRCEGKTNKQVSRIQYGYSDGSGEYYISIDLDRCNGCGECVSACPASAFEMISFDGAGQKARIKETARKRISIICPGDEQCAASKEKNCRMVCKSEAIGLSW